MNTGIYETAGFAVFACVYIIGSGIRVSFKKIISIVNSIVFQSIGNAFLWVFNKIKNAITGTDPNNVDNNDYSNINQSDRHEDVVDDNEVENN